MQQQVVNIQEALQYHQQGDLSRAEHLYKQILLANPHHPDALHLLGVICSQLGNHIAAIDYISKAISYKPNSPQFLNNLGNALKAQGRFDESISCFNKALQLKTDFAEAYHNLGDALDQQGKFKEAIDSYEKALRIRPEFAEAYMQMGVALKALGRLEEAKSSYEQALRIRPGYGEAYNNLGVVYKKQERWEEAKSCYQKAIEMMEEPAAALNNMGSVLSEEGRIEEAIECFKEAMGKGRGQILSETLFNLGNIVRSKNRLDEAIGYYQQSLHIKPNHAETLNNLGSVFQAQDKYEEATVCYQKALAVKPDYVDVYHNLGHSLALQGRIDEAKEAYLKAVKLKPSDGLKIIMSTFLPIILRSSNEINQVREQLDHNLSQLLKEKLNIKEPEKEIGTLPFYLAYHGLNDLHLNKKLAEVYAQSCPTLLYTSPHCLSHSNLHKTGKIKIGFISSNFKEHHIVWTVMKGIISNISRESFSVTLFSFHPVTEEISKTMQQSGDQIIQLSPTVKNAHEKIAEEKLDILFYCDIGMDPVTYFLALSRLAPIQCTAWGHPVTSGIKTIDYYISTDPDEVSHAQDHYSEKLVRLKKRPLYYYKPITTKPEAHLGISREKFKLDTDKHIYLCPASPFKIHPDFDEVIGGILRKDLDGQVLMVESFQSKSFELLMDRLRKTIPDVLDRVVLIPRLGLDEFRNLLSVIDVMLDTFPFNCGTTSLEAFAAGIPVVTLPGEFLRGRFTYAYYKQMEMLDLAVNSKDEYVQVATRLGCDKFYRGKMKKEILDRCGVLFEDTEAVRELEQFFIGLKDE